VGKKKNKYFLWIEYFLLVDFNYSKRKEIPLDPKHYYRSGVFLCPRNGDIPIELTESSAGGGVPTILSATDTIKTSPGFLWKGDSSFSFHKAREKFSIFI